jgi:phosphomevalonate kinase
VKARAPGKLVLSGAYSVLQGAPAIVTAVDRYALADASRSAERVTPEVKAALGGAAAPWFDASEQREGTEKLGLGSSAAILVASLAARELSARGPLPDAELRRLVLAPALAAHAAAQGGGSGVDVAASAHGGTLSFRLAVREPAIVRIELPSALVIETWWSGHAAVTSDFVRRVRELGERDPETQLELLGVQRDASERAENALLRGDAPGFIAALHAQRAALGALGRVAGVPIVTPEATRLAAVAAPASVLPAGAGGGDVLLHVGLEASTAAFRALASELGHRLLPLSLGARGVHAVDEF